MLNALTIKVSRLNDKWFYQKQAEAAAKRNFRPENSCLVAAFIFHTLEYPHRPAHAVWAKAKVSSVLACLIFSVHAWHNYGGAVVRCDIACKMPTAPHSSTPSGDNLQNPTAEAVAKSFLD